MFFKKPTHASGVSKEHIQTIGNCGSCIQISGFLLATAVLASTSS